jgi:hypothetical protein
MADSDVPVLTDLVAGPRVTPLGKLSDDDREALIAEVQTRMAADCFELVEGMIDEAARQVESILYQHVKAQLRAELPEVVEAVLRDIIARDSTD